MIQSCDKVPQIKLCNNIFCVVYNIPLSMRFFIQKSLTVFVKKLKAQCPIDKQVGMPVWWHPTLEIFPRFCFNFENVHVSVVCYYVYNFSGRSDSCHARTMQMQMQMPQDPSKAFKVCVLFIFICKQSKLNQNTALIIYSYISTNCETLKTVNNTTISGMSTVLQKRTNQIHDGQTTNGNIDHFCG